MPCTCIQVDARARCGWNAMAGDNGRSDEWVHELDANAYGVRLLTLDKACALAAQGYSAGWYISPFALKWTVGRMALDGRRYHVTNSGEPVCFENMAEAAEFLVDILRLTAAPQISLPCSRSAAKERPLSSKS